LFLVKVDYPQRDEEREIVSRTTGASSARLEAVIKGPEIQACQETVRKVLVPDHVMDFVLDVVRKTRPKDPGVPAFVKELISWGAGPRACQQWILGGKVRAVLQGRFHVTLDDVTALALPVLRHRIVATFNAEAEGVTVDEIIQKVLDATPRGDAKRVM
jgi:MoxR-like ATPase